MKLQDSLNEITPDMSKQRFKGLPMSAIDASIEKLEAIKDRYKKTHFLHKVTRTDLAWLYAERTRRTQ